MKRLVGGEDAPGFGVEIVGAGSYVFQPAEGVAFMGGEDDAPGCFGREDDGLATEIVNGLGGREFYLREGVGAQECRHGEGVARNEVAAFEYGQFEPGTIGGFAA